MEKEKYPEITNIQLEVLKTFAGIKGKGEFALAGGTALAVFYIHHRKSFDIDLFTTQEKIVRETGNNFMKELLKNNIQSELVRSSETFFEMTAKKNNESTIIQLAQDSPFKFEKDKKTELGINIESFTDIATNKLLALYGRNLDRDYIDVYFIVKEGHFNMPELIKKSKQKDPGLDEYYLSIAFQKVNDVIKDNNKLRLMMLKSVDVKDLKIFYSKEAATLLDRKKEKKKSKGFER